MFTRFVVLLLAATTLGGVLYVLVGGKPKKRPAPSPAPPRLIRTTPEPAATPAPALTPATGAPAHTNSSRRRRPTLSLRPEPRILVLLVAAAIFGPGSYVALADEPAQGSPVTVQSMTAPEFAAEEHNSTTKQPAEDDLRSELPEIDRGAAALARLSPPTAPTATPTPAPVVEAASAPEAERAPERAPAPEPEPAREPEPTPLLIPTDGFEAIICALPWSCWEAIAVAACESGRDLSGRLDGNWATNGSHFGLFQISYIHAWRWADFYDNWMDPARNAEWAYEIWSESGWYPWSCQPWY